MGDAAADRDEGIRADQHPRVRLVEDVAACQPEPVGGSGGLLARLVDGPAAEAEPEAERVHPGGRDRRRLGQLVEEGAHVHRDRLAAVLVEDRAEPRGDLVHRPFRFDRRVYAVVAADERMTQSGVRGVDVGIVLPLPADEASGGRVALVAARGDRTALLVDVDEDRTVGRADAAEGLLRGDRQGRILFGGHT